jgi:exoribonuclease R
MYSINAEVQLRNHKYFYVVSGSESAHELLRSDLTPLLIPGDTIQVENHQAITIVERQPQHTIAIIRGITNGCVFLYCPLLSPFYNPSVPLSVFQTTTKIDIQIGSRVLILIHITNAKDSIDIIKTYSNKRSQDFECIRDMYLTAEAPSISLADHAGTPLYTKPFQNLNDLPTFTVDPAESRDFDDAISIVGSTVYVHIVDIHSQMPASSAEDIEAARLAFTLYTSEGNHNIVPAEKAEHKWSLVADEERHVITVEIQYNGDYQVESYDIYPSSIIVKHRYNYENAPYIHLAKMLTERANRYIHALPQLKLAINQHTGQVYDVQHIYNTDEAHRMIETFMITANMIVSNHLRSHSPAYARVPQRFHTKLRGLPTYPPTGDSVVDSFLAIKTYAFAVYDPEKCGHYGLNLSSYTHFTSPIRRYFDVIMHRMLAGVQYTDTELQTLLSHINRREALISSLTKLYTQWKLLDTLNVGDSLDITMTRICPSGVYYLYKPYMLDGFIHVSSLGGGERWNIDETDGKQLVGASSKQIIKIGTCLKCRITALDPIKQLLVLAAASH